MIQEQLQNTPRAEAGHKSLIQLYNAAEDQIIATRTHALLADIEVIQKSLAISELNETPNLSSGKAGLHTKRTRERREAVERAVNSRRREQLTISDEWAGEQGKTNLANVWSHTLGELSIDDQADNQLIWMLSADYAQVTNMSLEYLRTSLGEESEQTLFELGNHSTFTPLQLTNLSQAWEESREYGESEIGYRILEQRWAEILGITRPTNSAHHEVYRKRMGEALMEISKYVGAIVKPTLPKLQKQFLLTAITDVPTAEVDLNSAPKIADDINTQMQLCFEDLKNYRYSGDTALGEAMISRLEVFLNKYSALFEPLLLRSGYRMPKDALSPEQFDQYLFLLVFLDTSWELIDSFYKEHGDSEYDEVSWDPNELGYIPLATKPGVPSDRLKALLYGTPEHEEAWKRRRERKGLERTLTKMINELAKSNLAKDVVITRPLGSTEVMIKPYSVSDMDNETLIFNTQIAIQIEALVKLAQNTNYLELASSNQVPKPKPSVEQENAMILIRSRIEDALWELSRQGKATPEEMRPALEYLHALQHSVATRFSYPGFDCHAYFISWYRGIISPFYARCLYTQNGYKLEKNTDQDMLRNDHNKVDLVVEKNDERYYVQVKSTSGISTEVEPVIGKPGTVRLSYPYNSIMQQPKEMTEDAFLNTLSDDRKDKFRKLLKRLNTDTVADSQQGNKVSWRLLMVNPINPYFAGK